MENIITTRRIKMNYTIHWISFVLTPKFYDTRFLETTAPWDITWKAPNKDEEVVTTIMLAFKKSQEQKLLRDEFAIFHMKKKTYMQLLQSK